MDGVGARVRFPVLLASLLLFVGCAAHRSGDAVRSIRFEGNTRKGYGGLLAPQSDRALKVAMNQPTPRWQSFVAPGVIEPSWLDRGVLDVDARRIEVWYANHGFFDARFLGWEIAAAKVRPGRRLRPVDVIGHVDQGEPSRIVSVEIEGMGKLLEPTQRRLRELAAITKGDIFDEGAYREAIRAMEGHLRGNAYAYAHVDGEVEVHPERHEAVVRLRVTPGPVCTFGAVTFTGKPGVDTDLLLPLVKIRTGAGFSTRAIALTRANLFALRVFAVVNVLPDLSDPTRSAVPIRIELRGTASHEVQAGPSFKLEPGEQFLVGAVRYNDYDVARRLWRWETEATAGVATLVETLSGLDALNPASDIAPIASVKTKFTMPRLADHWTLTNEAEVSLDASPGYRILTPSYRPSVSFDGIAQLTPSVAYRVEYIDYFTPAFQTDLGSTTTVSCADAVFGDNVIDPGLLSVFEQGLTWDSRDDPIEPHHGVYWNLGTAEAGAGGNFAFLKAAGDARLFRVVFPRRIEDFVLAGRVGGGLIQPLGAGDKARVPRPERFYLGGGTTVRGWAANTLGPLDTTDQDICDTGLPTGGKFMLYGNFEPRVRVYGNLLVATFVDVGRVWTRVQDFDPRELQVSVGGGFRYVTAIGPVRLDFAYVVNQDAYFAQRVANPWAVHFGLSEAF